MILDKTVGVVNYCFYRDYLLILGKKENSVILNKSGTWS